MTPTGPSFSSRQPWRPETSRLHTYIRMRTNSSMFSKESLMCMWARKPSRYEQENACSFLDSCRTHSSFVRLGFKYSLYSHPADSKVLFAARVQPLKI